MTDPNTLDDVFEGLASERRRLVVWYLREREKAVTLDDLATVVASWLAARSGNGGTGPREREAVRAALYHRDLPKLDETGLVTYDRDAATVSFQSSPLATTVLDVVAALDSVDDASLTDGEDVTHREA